MTHLRAAAHVVQRRTEGLWEGRGRCCVHGRCARLALCRHALARYRARPFEMASVSGSVLRLVDRRGPAVGFLIGCAARCLCCFAPCRARGRLVVRAGCRARAAGRVVARCLTLCVCVCVCVYRRSCWRRVIIWG